MERIEISKWPGKRYENTGELINDIKKFREKNKAIIESQSNDTANILVLRIFGKELAKFREDDKEYWSLVDSQKPTTFVSASIYKINDGVIDLNINDWNKYEWGKKSPTLYCLSLNNDTVKSYRLEPVLKKLKR
ncbi:MAG: hypothetical protein PHC97_02125 [Patescibacteria group bacterium]|nr:hypothetical protein [Patescibacteria group bacterium]